MSVMTRQRRRQTIYPRETNTLFGRLVNWHPIRLTDVCRNESWDLARTWTPGTFFAGSSRASMMPSDRPGGGAHVQLGTPGTLIGSSPFNPQFRVSMDSGLNTTMQGPRSFAMWLRWESVSGSAASIEFFWSLNADLNAFSGVWGRWFTNTSGQILNDNGPPGGSWSALYTMPRSRWVHLTVTYDPATRLQSLYADGVLIGVLTETGGRSYGVNFETLVFGSGQISNVAPISIADFAQFSTCLDGAQVQAWYEDSLRGHPVAFGVQRPVYGTFAPAAAAGPPPGSRGLLGVGR